MQQRVVINDLIKVAVCIWMAFTATMAVGANSSGDSIKVVKGQVSDYYIPVVKEYTITGTVSDENGKALEGATVMFFASPVHCNTDAEGHYTHTEVHRWRPTRVCVLSRQGVRQRDSRSGAA